MNGNWQVWVRYCGGEVVSIYMVRKGTDGFSNVVVVDLGFTTLLTSQVISIAFYSEHKKSDEFCSEALILT